jgi:hypothetical protein
VLGLTKRRQPPDVQKALAKQTKEMPDEPACELFAECTVWPLSARTAYEVAVGVTVLDVARSRGEVHSVMWGLQPMKATNAQAAEEIERLIRYLQRHQQRRDSRYARQRGYPIGSSRIESTNKCICHMHLKRS